MGQHVAIRNKLSGTLIVSAMSLGTLAATGLGSLPTAGATCASFFGLGNSAACSSNFTTIAIAIGANAQAHADGHLGGAFVMGENSRATLESTGFLGIAIGLGANGITNVGRGFADIAVNLTTASVKPTVVSAVGTANIAVNLWGGASNTFRHVVGAQGIGNIAVNVFGSDNHVLAGTGASSFGNTAFNALGYDNEVTASGPFALAGALGQQSVAVAKTGPGFNLGLQVGTAASTRNPMNAIHNGSAVNTGTALRATGIGDEPPATKTGGVGHGRTAADR